MVILLTLKPKVNIRLLRKWKRLPSVFDGVKPVEEKRKIRVLNLPPKVNHAFRMKLLKSSPVLFHYW